MLDNMLDQSGQSFALGAISLTYGCYMDVTEQMPISIIADQQYKLAVLSCIEASFFHAFRTVSVTFLGVLVGMLSTCFHKYSLLQNLISDALQGLPISS